MFLTWLTVFLLFSGLGGFATEVWIPIVARFVTGVSAGFLTPAGLSIITTTFPEGQARNPALMVYAGTAAAGFSLGLVVGGLLTEIDWRWVFFAPVLIAAPILVAAIRLIPDPGPADRLAGRFDLAGAGSVTGAMLLAVFTVVKAPDVAAIQTLVTVLASAGLFVAFAATATCCRTCLARWHDIPAGRALDDAERNYVVEAICRWIVGQYAPPPAAVTGSRRRYGLTSGSRFEPARKVSAALIEGIDGAGLQE